MGSLSISNNLPYVEATNTSDKASTAPILTYTIGRVLNVELEDPALLGVITYIPVYSPAATTGTARPISQNIKQYPLPDELVMIVQGPSSAINDGVFRPEEYYTSPYSLWSTSHHNKFPNLREYEKQLIEKEVTSDTKPVTSSADIEQKENIKTLKAYPGDLIVEGRWGHSIRFGSTEGSKKSPWSNGVVNEENIGDPVLIIANGQATTATDVWDLTVEDINKDSSSIWLTTTQQVDIEDIQKNFSLESFASSQELSTDKILQITGLPVSYTRVSRSQQDTLNNRTQ